jgi:hypothetical protein
VEASVVEVSVEALVAAASAAVEPEAVFEKVKF